jgi:hypothetical protein
VRFVLLRNLGLLEFLLGLSLLGLYFLELNLLE